MHSPFHSLEKVTKFQDLSLGGSETHSKVVLLENNFQIAVSASCTKESIDAVALL